MIGWLIVAGIMLPIGLLMLWLTNYERRQLRAAAGWPTVTGRVVRSEVEARRTTDHRDADITRFRPVIHYAYEVAGRS